MHVARAVLVAGLACGHAAPSSEGDALRWGTYHSGLYFGIRSRTSPFHVSAGLLWATSRESNLRHECLESDRLEQYGWRQHDGRTFGSQEIRDQHNNLLLDTTFLKPPTSPTTFATRSWAARIAMSPLRADDALPDVNSLYFYLDLGCEDDSLVHPCRRDTQQGAKWTVRAPAPCRQPPSDGKSCVEMEIISEHSSELLAFNARYQVHFHGKPSDVEIAYQGDSSWSVVNIKKSLDDLASRQAMENPSSVATPSATPVTLSNTIAPSSTLAVVLVRHDPSLVQDVTLHLLYDEQVDAETTPVVVFDDVLPSLHAAFASKFAAAFPIADPFSTVGQAALSNLIGGIGYFYGSTVLQGADGKPGVTPARSLFTAVPSRSFFPRGFLWDEGFHQLGIVPFDPDVAVQVVGAWLDLMDEDGYISREQIRGTLAEARVPAEFITQYTTHANPPTLLLAIEKLLPHIVDSPILHEWWPKLQRWYAWYQRTQAGPEPNTFRWRGRDINDGKLMPNTLSSGLDDYPRASHPSNDERHVDLAAWMIKGSAILARIAHAVGDEPKAASLEQLSHMYLETMDKLHWDAARSLYFDYGLHSEDGTFEDHIVIRCQNPSTGDSIQTTANVEVLQKSRNDGCPRTHPQFQYPLGDGNGGLLRKQVFAPKTEMLQFVRRVGYVSFFPLFLQLLPADSPKLQPLGTHLVSHLLSPHGLLSLSPADLYFERPNAPGDAPYWRGPIWININYLALSSFKHYATHAQDAAVRQQYDDLYRSLRKGVVASITNEFHATGYLYEQYNQRTGRGQRCHPFSGWTALIVNILAETY